MQQSSNVKRFVPKGWQHYKDNYSDFYYNPKEFCISLDAKARPYCRYCGVSTCPSQPIGLDDYYQMFVNYAGIELDLSHWDVSGVRNFSRMFLNDSNLQRVSIDTWRFDNAVFMNEMFSYCISLNFFSLCEKDFPKLKSLDGMWSFCEKLLELDLRDWYLPKLCSMHSFCESCLNLQRLNIRGWTFFNDVNDTQFLNNCVSLKNVIVR